MSQPSRTTEKAQGPTVHPPVDDADLWILAGQSNMQGSAPIDAATALETTEGLWALEMDGQWSPATPLLHHIFAAWAPVHRRLMAEFGASDTLLDSLAAQGRSATPLNAGPGYYFGGSMLRHLPPGRRIVLLPCAHGGTRLDQWDPDAPTDAAGGPGQTLYGAMLEQVRRSGLRPRGMLWYQGESDAQKHLSRSYLRRFLGLIDRLRTDLGDPEFPIFVVQLGGLAGTADGLFNATSWDHVRQAQREAAERRERVYLTTAVDGTLSDMIHIDHASVITVGERLARMALKHVEGLDAHGGDTLRVAQATTAIFPWEHPLLRFDYPTVTLRIAGARGALRSTGKPAGFTIRQRPARGLPMDVWKVELNAEGPGTLRIFINPSATARQIGICYGAGLNPPCNITDEAGMALPAFGPLWIDYPRP